MISDKPKLHKSIYTFTTAIGTAIVASNRGVDGIGAKPRFYMTTYSQFTPAVRIDHSLRQASCVWIHMYDSLPVVAAKLHVNRSHAARHARRSCHRVVRCPDRSALWRAPDCWLFFLQVWSVHHGPTSDINIFSQTDALVQRVICRVFAGCTVLMVAQWLHTIAGVQSRCQTTAEGLQLLCRLIPIFS